MGIFHHLSFNLTAYASNESFESENGWKRKWMLLKDIFLFFCHTFLLVRIRNLDFPLDYWRHDFLTFFWLRGHYFPLLKAYIAEYL